MGNKSVIDARIEKVLITEKEIDKKIEEAAQWIDENYKNKTPILVAILKGAFPFYGKLVTKISTDVVLDFMVVSSFHGELTAQSEPEIVTDLINKVKGQDVILVEDVIDTARTMSLVVKTLLGRGAKSVKVITLVDKPTCRLVDFKADFVGFEIGKQFIVGFGLDYKEVLRNLPYIGILKEEVYKEK